MIRAGNNINGHQWGWLWGCLHTRQNGREDQVSLEIHKEWGREVLTHPEAPEESFLLEDPSTKVKVNTDRVRPSFSGGAQKK